MKGVRVCVLVISDFSDGWSRYCASGWLTAMNNVRECTFWPFSCTWHVANLIKAFQLTGKLHWLALHPSPGTASNQRSVPHGKLKSSSKLVSSVDLKVLVHTVRSWFQRLQIL